MRRVFDNIIKIAFFSIIFISLTFYTGSRNSEDTIFRSIDFEGVTDKVRVYRDELGTPTIIAQNLNDLAFIQGYEFARDRTWQLEYYRSIVNGELSKLFGGDLVETDIFIRSLGFRRAAENLLTRLSPQLLSYVQSYVEGINIFYEEHQFNLPLEYVILGVEPKEWNIVDSLAMQGVMAFNLGFGGLENELLRLDIINKIGVNGTLELFPVEYSPAEDFLLDYSIPDLPPLQLHENPLKPILSLPSGLDTFASNAWVVNGSRTQNGFPIIANDPHLGLEVPSLWYQVNLQLEDNSFNVQGFTIPGVPFVLVGHNKHIAWGATAAMTDAVDLFHLTSNETHYYMNHTWNAFETIDETVEITGLQDREIKIRISKLGPLVNTTHGEFAIKWTLLESYDRDLMLKAIFDLNSARNLEEAHEALNYFVAPGVNFVLADVSGDIGYQYAGLIPSRLRGDGLLPLNGSGGISGWNGSIPYVDQLYIINPEDGYIVNANQRIDNRELFYISEGYALNYRADRLNQIFENGTEFNGNEPLKLTIDDMKLIQNDIVNLAAKDLLNPVIDGLASYSYLNEREELILDIIERLRNWDFRMDSKSIEATVYAAYRIMLIRETFIDEFGSDLTDKINYIGVGSVVRLLNSNLNSVWFDNQLTDNRVEDAIDIAARALNLAIDYLIDNFGSDQSFWSWGIIHQVTFKHPMGDAGVVLTGLNVGPLPSNGSTFTVNSYLTAPGIVDGELNFESSYGPSFKLIIEVEATWSNVVGVLPPGISGHLLSVHYQDGFDKLENNEYHTWTFNRDQIISSDEFTAEFE